jgi:hypothetical protein
VFVGVFFFQQCFFTKTIGNLTKQFKVLHGALER